MTGTNGHGNGTDRVVDDQVRGDGEATERPAPERVRRGAAVVKVAGDAILDRCSAAVVKAEGSAALERCSTNVLKAGGDVTVSNSAVNTVRAERDVHMKNGGAAALVAGNDLALTNGGAAVLVAGRDLVVQRGEDSGAQVTLALAARDAHMENSFVGIAISGRASLAGARVLVNLPLGSLFEAAIDGVLGTADRLLGWLEGAQA